MQMDAVPRRTLYLCRTATEACLGAVGQENPGMAVAVAEIDGILVVRWGEATVFGPVDRTASEPERSLVEGLVVDTLETGEKDVYFACVDEAIREGIADRAVLLGHALKQPLPVAPPSVAEPFSLFGARRIRAKPGASGGVMSFCELDPAEHRPLVVGDRIRMATEAAADGGTEVGYVDDRGWLLGLHGKVPFTLDEESLARVAEVEIEVTYVSWGRSWRNERLRDVQFLIFEIPPDVDAMLADARLPPSRGRGQARALRTKENELTVL